MKFNEDSRVKIPTILHLMRLGYEYLSLKEPNTSTIEQLDDQQLAQLFYPESDTRSPDDFQCPDWVEVHQELKGKGVTKHLLWE
ncbi:MAG: hypothetical protein HOM14_15935 [Gammaproteobacteria bacterium]|jgi:hypothetical protein|nr:hypothetical protein [Gammaproteobacteria bacterium]MBT3725846.1 hypothetical protein [Gammaproteobacteria bacterium]MBT4195725.1 hypothetical protein [Gammaproteobacteria bacterium]MBT4450802.1 hypothetical protein [Gammaproteobacteria bacterium]MBT4860506.1 hypothetical protein [Gammaproteobacteria bacterium]